MRSKCVPASGQKSTGFDMGRNWLWSVSHGRTKRLALEREAAERGIAEDAVDRTPPLHSHDGTMQDLFVRGWLSVTPTEIYRVRSGVTAPVSHSTSFFSPSNEADSAMQYGRDKCASLRAILNNKDMS